MNETANRPGIPAKTSIFPSRVSAGWACATIVVAALAAYHNSFGGAFVFDDLTSIPNNPTIRHLWPLGDVLRPPHDTTVEGRPMLNFSLALNYAVSGTHVWSYHALNLLIHTFAGLALFGIVRRTVIISSGTEKTKADASYIALAIALLWTVHPLQTEAVTYVVQRAESLMGLLYLLTLYCFLRGTASGQGKPARGWHALSVVTCFLGMATKEVMVSAPVIIFLYDRTFISTTFRQAWKRRWGLYLLLASTWMLLLASIVMEGGDRSGSKGFGTTVSWSTFAATQFPAVVQYLRLAFWPQPLVFEYGTFWVNDIAAILPSVVLVVILLSGTLWALRARPSLGFLGACFFAILAPTSLTPGIGQMIVEHRMYLPLAAVLCVIIPAWYMASGCRRTPFIILVVAIATASAACTAQRNAAYASELSLWADTVAKRPANAIARINFGNTLLGAGRSQEAIAQYDSAFQLNPNPDYPIAHNNLGIALDRVGHTREAIVQFQKSVQLDPHYAKAHYNLGIALSKSGQMDAAIAQLEAAVRLAPNDAEARYNLGTSLGQIGRTSEAIPQLEAAVRLKPEDAGAHNNLGIALYVSGQIPEAILQFEEVMRINPENAGARTALEKLRASSNPQ
jgi:Flp pilus assembly protein TadD